MVERKRIDELVIKEGDGIRTSRVIIYNGLSISDTGTLVGFSSENTFFLDGARTLKSHYNNVRGSSLFPLTDSVLSLVMTY